jgi:hypothetical protein
MSAQDKISGFNDIEVWHNDLGYVVLSQFDPSESETHTIAIPARIVDSLIKLLRSHKRAADALASKGRGSK